MDLDDLIAVDVHTHAWKSALRVDDAPSESREESAAKLPGLRA